MPSIYSFSAQSLTGEKIDLLRYAQQVVLVVNVASECGFTPQYQGLQAIYQEFKDQGLVILGFPCNQFGHQEPGGPAEIQAFCSTTYGVSFPLFDKIEVNGPHTHPLFAWLKSEKPGALGTQRIKWNFTKFLCGRDGQAIQRYGSTTKPDELRQPIEQALNQHPDPA
jgi:glutathione peroxidase